MSESQESLLADTTERLRPWKLPAQTTYIFKNANVVDTAAGVIIPNRRVKISHGYIEFVKLATLSHGNEQVVVVDLAGRYLCPGLIDCHVHLSAVPGEAIDLGGETGPDPAAIHCKQPFLCHQMLSRGFTAVRDMGGARLALKQAIEDDVFPGPRVFICDKGLSPTGGPGDQLKYNMDHFGCCAYEGDTSAIVDGVSECIRATREQLRDGADFIKIMVGDGPGGAHAGPTTESIGHAQFTAEEVRAIVDVAEGHGTSVHAYAHSPGAIRLAVENGVKGIEHGTLIDEQTARYMAEKGVWFTPTLVAYAGNSSTVAGPPSFATALKNSMMLDQIAAALWHAHGARVKMCHGSDLLGPFQAYQSRDFGLRAAVLDGKTVLQGATVNAAEMLGQGGLLGQVKEGFAADLLVLNENPLKDVRILAEPEKHILAVIKNGRVCVSRWSKLPVDDVKQTMIE